MAAIDDKSLQVTLDKDPGMELFAGRNVALQAEDGKVSKLNIVMLLVKELSVSLM
ncbi:hypothetical protein [Lysinibacillus parviboronicapiens]|uniref:hypothetical protein n=1 Tax=Lysinibacillus parviboronicapiens TaxID=436516 RepID=UPI00187D2553|nr:hypothetical protein [Lysinibacillus parviboronicapiens]